VSFTFVPDLVPGIKNGIKREVRCKSGAIPVAVSNAPFPGGIGKHLKILPLFINGKALR